jgi:4-azaleucine resistance transporter AzlC
MIRVSHSLAETDFESDLGSRLVRTTKTTESRVTETDHETSTKGGHDETASESDDQPTQVRFNRRGVRIGFLTCIPIAFGVAGYGVAFGVLANQAGLSVAEAALMSGLVVAGASQIVAIELWADPIPIATIVLATFAINLRYSLMGAALQPWFRHLSAKRAYGSLFLMADENWALTMRDLKNGSGRGAFLLGSGLAVWLFWVGSTIVGTIAGGAIGDPASYGIDFILAAVFVALAVELWEGRSTLIPWTVAFATALVFHTILPGQWYILLGGIAAAISEVIRHG